MFGIIDLLCNVPVTWQPLQVAIFCSNACAWATLPPANPRSRSSAQQTTTVRAVARVGSRPTKRLGLLSVGKHIVFIATLIIQLRITARADNDILLTIEYVG